MKKRFTALLIAAMFMFSFGAVGSLAVESEDVGENAAPSLETCDYVLFEAEEVTDIDELIARAQAGVDELEENTGISFEATADVTQSNASPARYLGESSYEDIEVDVFQTSQLLGEFVYDGELIQQYAIVGIATLKIEEGETAKLNGCTLVSKMYLNLGNDSSTPPKYVMNLLRTTATVSGGSPQMLAMGQRVFTGWDTNKNYVAENSFNFPNGTYSLNAAYTGDIYETGNYTIGENRVFFSGGISMVAKVSYDF